MKILVVGSGAREHALVIALTRDPQVTGVLAAPGNPGMAELARCLPEIGDVTDPVVVVAAAREHEVDLVVIGPEAPLVTGVGDAVREAGIPCCGPGAAAAMLEGSKAFAKEVMAAADVPTGRSVVCTTDAQVRAALEATAPPYVVKDDGLAGGKGVVVTDDLDQAIEHARGCLARAPGRVVVEEFLEGPEVSLFCLTDGRTVVPLAPAQDFKRIGEGETGLNTGGMGAYSPLPWAQDQLPDLVETVVQRIARPTVTELARRGVPFVGVLFIGLALTRRGPQVIEFNARFGDPETQVVLARLRTPLGALLYAVATGTLEEVPPLAWIQDSALTVVLAAPGYPQAPRPGGPVRGLERVDQVPGTQVLHAGTARDESGALVSSGGRVLSVVALGADLAQARDRAYAAVQLLDVPDSVYRRDIGAAAAAGEIVIPASPGTSTAPADPPTHAPAYEGRVEGHLLLHSGKVRDLHVPVDPVTGEPDGTRVLLVASDRISAYDQVLDPPVPDKGAILTELSSWWFEQLGDLVPHHLISTDVPSPVRRRAVYVQRLQMLPVEAIGRAYLTGGGLTEYLAHGSVCGVRLPPGLVDGSRLPEPIFTPSTKAPAGEHDRPMKFPELEDLLGPGLARRVRELTLAILARANEIASGQGILIADTKIELGIDPASAGRRTHSQEPVDWAELDPDTVRLVLADEVLTPDSSRFWRESQWAPGHPQTSYDKQVLRDWLTGPDSGWDPRSGAPAPSLPEHVVTLTRARYLEAFQALTGRPFDPVSR